MIECKDMCNIRKEFACCHTCHMKSCEDRCTQTPDSCGQATDVGMTVNEIQTFESKALQVMKSIVDIDRQKKMLDAQDAEMREQLQKAMDEYGIKNFENDILKITYVMPTTRETVDSKKLKADLPEVAAKYTKITQVKGSVRIQVK